MSGEVFTHRHTLYKCFRSGSGFLFYFVCNVSVHVQSESCGCMAEVTLDGFDIIVGANRGHSVTVPESVETSIGAADGLNNTLEGSIRLHISTLESWRSANQPGQMCGIKVKAFRKLCL